ncbi:MAG TPA: thioredoxin family protein, partial [bacterium]|nr:thioredoxin family protein [bacterium]
MTLDLGSQAPDFSLPGTDGKTWSLASFKDAKALCVVFSCNHCPYVKAYEGRFVGLQKDLGPGGFQMVAINSNDAVSHPEDGFEAMQARAREKGFNFPYLRDESQAV